MHAIKEAAMFVVFLLSYMIVVSGVAFAFVAVGALAAYFLPTAVSILFAIIVFILAAVVLTKYF